MENIICDISAFDYWRIPPLVQLLLVGDETHPTLRKLFKEEEVLAAREAIASAPACKTILGPSMHARNKGDIAKSLTPAVPLLAANHTGPIDIMVDRRSKCHSSSILRTRMTSQDLPIGATAFIDEYLQATTPAFTLLQLAGRASLARTIMLATEICGTFSIFKAPQPVQAVLQNAIRRSATLKVGGWEPFIDAHGLLTNLWSRPALTTPQELAKVASEVHSKRGCERLRVAAALTMPNAASPFEARAGMLLGMSRSRGGEGFKGLSLNKRVELSSSAQALAHRRYCVCDLYWEKGLDVECQSASVHNNAASFLSDSDRTVALRHMGIDVLPITHNQLRSTTRFAALSETIASILDMRFRPRTQRQVAAAQALRSELFVDWTTIHRV